MKEIDCASISDVDSHHLRMRSYVCKYSCFPYGSEMIKRDTFYVYNLKGFLERGVHIGEESMATLTSGTKFVLLEIETTFFGSRNADKC